MQNALICMVAGQPEVDSVAAPGEWMGHPPTGRRFSDVDEIYIFRVRDGKLAGAFGIEDNLGRMRQLGLST